MTTTTTTLSPFGPGANPFGPGDAVWTCVVGPGKTLYTVAYKAGQGDDFRFNFENDNSSIDLPGYVLYGQSAQLLDQAKRDILGYPLVSAGLSAGFYVSRITPMTALPFLQLSNARPYLFAVQLSGTGWGVPLDSVVKNSALCFPIYRWAKVNTHYETLTYDVFTDAEMILIGATDADGNPDEATLARYVTKEVQPGMEYLTLPQGSFHFVATPGGLNGPVVAGAAGKLVPNYDISLTWEMVPQSCIGTVLYNPNLDNPPIDDCLGCCNEAPFPPALGANNQELATAVPAAGGSSYNIGDLLVLLGGFGIPSATLIVDAVGGSGQVTSVIINTRGNYATSGGLPSPPASPAATDSSGVGTGCTLTVTFQSVVSQQLMTAYPAEAGTGYALGDVLTLVGGVFGTAATVRVVALSATGATGPVLAVEIIELGSYRVTALPSPPANPVSTTGGLGSGCTLTCEFGNGIPPGQLLMTAATITPIRSSAGDRLFRLAYRYKYLPQGIQRLYYPGTAGYVNGPTVVISTVANTINPLITTATPHSFSVGNTVSISGVTGAPTVNAVFQVATVPSPTTFTIVLAAPGAGTGGQVGLSGAFQDGGYFEVSTNGFTNIGLNLYNSDAQTPPANIYPWADFATLFRVPS